tara:strand:- start:1413 stop:1679 length:267 start_codon:yes stop_codon:yes gene_type:complete
MKKLLLFSLPAMFACGTDTQTQAENFAAHHVTIPRAAICENLDASVREHMDAGEYEKLCGHPKVCEEFEAEMVCEGEWCVIHRTCRLK